MLFPTTVITEVAGDNRYYIPSGSLFVFPVEIRSEEAKKIFLMHIDPTQQDRSLRAWISVEVGGGEVIPYPIDTSSWHVGRNPHHVVGVYDEAYYPPEVPFLVPVPVGQYYLHVLNLTNRQNAFSYFIDGAG